MTPIALAGRVLAPGAAEGEAVVLQEPLSLWGGMDPATGRVVEARHPQHGVSLTGRIVVMPGGRGSSSSASVLAESARAGRGPAAIVLGEPDLILAIGAAVAEELYGRAIPVVVLPADTVAEVTTGDHLSVEPDGTVRVAHPDDLRTLPTKPETDTLQA